MCYNFSYEVTSRSITAARDVTSSETEIQEGFYVDITLKGDYTAQKTIPVTEGVSAVFEGISVGAKISATASAYEIFPYEMEIQKIVLYTASSEEIRVKEGKNTIRLKFTEPSSSSFISICVTAKTLDNSEEDTGDGSEDNPFASLSAALNQINEYADSTVNYTIVLSGEFTAMHEIPSSLDGKAASITLTGKKGNTTDILSGAIGDNNYHARRVATTVPVTITNLKITGGKFIIKSGMIGWPVPFEHDSSSSQTQYPDRFCSDHRPKTRMVNCCRNLLF